LFFSFASNFTAPKSVSVRNELHRRSRA